MTDDWRVNLEAARLPPTREQQVWDGHWRRWHGIAVRSGRTSNDAIAIAWTRTTDQYGPRPGGTQPAEENQT